MDFLTDVNFWRSLTTVLSLMIFLGIVWWAYLPRRKRELDVAANLPFQTDKEST